jgi:hypothetical protein
LKCSGFEKKTMTINRYQKIDTSNSAPSSKTFRDETGWCSSNAQDFYNIPAVLPIILTVIFYCFPPSLQADFGIVPKNKL